MSASRNRPFLRGLKRSSILRFRVETFHGTCGFYRSLVFMSWLSGAGSRPNFKTLLGVGVLKAMGAWANNKDENLANRFAICSPWRCMPSCRKLWCRRSWSWKIANFVMRRHEVNFCAFDRMPYVAWPITGWNWRIWRWFIGGTKRVRLDGRKSWYRMPLQKIRSQTQRNPRRQPPRPRQPTSSSANVSQSHLSPVHLSGSWSGPVTCEEKVSKDPMSPVKKNAKKENWKKTLKKSALTSEEFQRLQKLSPGKERLIKQRWLDGSSLTRATRAPRHPGKQWLMKYGR